MNDLKSILSGYDKVYIQTHNFPDADAIASACGLKRLIDSFQQPAEIIFFGNNTFKPNIDNMVNRYRIKMTVIGEGFEIGPNELLFVVDGQYGAGNVIRVEAKNIAVIDHHHEEKSINLLYQDVQPKIGACTTIIYHLLKQYDVQIDTSLATILYFGILMDTDTFTGKMTTLDNEAKTDLESIYDKKAIDYLRLSSMSFDDLKIYANGILKTERYNQIVFSCIDECDDNLLGHISDLFSEIDGVDIVVVYSPRGNGYKLSIRSYHDYITAEEITRELTDGFGSGGGHTNKAGGYIFKERYDKSYPKVSFGLYIRSKTIDYCREVRLLVTGKDDPFALFGHDKFFRAKKKQIYLRYLCLHDYFADEIVTIKTLEGIVTAAKDDKVIIGVKNEVWPISSELFLQKYQTVHDNKINCLSDSQIDEYGISLQSDSKILRITKNNITDFNVCLTSDGAEVYALKLNEIVKVRSSWGDFLAKKGDYLLINNMNDYYICDQEIFELTYNIV